MSTKWKVTIGVIVAAVVVSGIGLLCLGSVIYRNSDGEYGWSPVAYVSELVWGAGASAYLPEPSWGPAAYKVRLVDDDEDGVPDRGVIEVPTAAAFGWDFGPEGEVEVTTPWEVDLVDDDGDGIPDRGVIEAPTADAFGWDFGSDHSWPFGHARRRVFDRGFGPGRGVAAFASLAIVGGLACLACLALLTGAGIVFLRRRSRKDIERNKE
jgi:hypothetical protein